MARNPPRPGSIIVAVDDDADDADLLRLLLRKAGVEHPVEVYRHGEEVISALGEVAGNGKPPPDAGRPLLCFLDIKMPGIGGHEVLSWIREQRPLDRLPVIMLSSSEHPEDIRRAASGGAQCYLAKYPQPTVLREVIEEAERFAGGLPEIECFRMPTNLLLVRARRV